MSARRSRRDIPTLAGGVVRARLAGSWLRHLVDDFLFSARLSLETGDPSYVRAWADPSAFLADGGVRDAAGVVHPVETDPDRIRAHVRAGTLALDQDDAGYDPPALRVPTTQGVVSIRPSDRAEERYARDFLAALDRWKASGDKAHLEPYYRRTVADGPPGAARTYRLLTNPRRLALLIDAGALVIGDDLDREGGPDNA